jgi:hypothetical protein
MMSDSVLTDAMDVVLQWGPDRMVPEADRLRRKHPNLSDDEAGQALAQAWKVMGEAEAFAPGIKRGSETNATSRLQAGRPWLTDDQASRAINQGLYSHWRETGE